MKVYFEQTGGLVGVGSHGSVDSDSLPPEEASELQRLIVGANFLQLQSQSSIPSRGADYLEYKITLETNDIKHSFSFTDLTMPLVNYLREKVNK